MDPGTGGPRHPGVVHHSDKGVQYVAVRYTQRLAEAGAVASAGSTGDLCDNSLAEAFNSLFKAELICNKGPWESIDDLEIAVAEYVDWFDHRRLHGETGLVPPVEFEDAYCRHHTVPATAEAALPSLYGTRYGTEGSTPITDGYHREGGMSPGRRCFARPRAADGRRVADLER